MLAPLCGSSIMSLRSMALNRPLRDRSSATTRATSKDSAAASAPMNGTIAMGMASSCPRVTSTTKSPHEREQKSKRPRTAIEQSALFIGLEPKCEFSLEKRRIRRVRQRRSAIDRVFDGLANRRIAIALGNPRVGDLAARHLGDFDQAVYADARRGRFNPRMLNAIAQARDVAIAQGTGLDRADVLLLGHLAPQFSLALLARTIVSRFDLRAMLDIRGLFSFGRLLGVGRPLRFGGAYTCGIGFIVRLGVGGRFDRLGSLRLFRP